MKTDLNTLFAIAGVTCDFVAKKLKQRTGFVMQLINSNKHCRYFSPRIERILLSYAKKNIGKHQKKIARMKKLPVSVQLKEQYSPSLSNLQSGTPTDTNWDRSLEDDREFVKELGLVQCSGESCYNFIKKIDGVEKHYCSEFCESFDPFGLKEIAA